MEMDSTERREPYGRRDRQLDEWLGLVDRRQNVRRFEDREQSVAERNPRLNPVFVDVFERLGL